eukprot:TRINITY_DN3664_c0_g1_i1.p1 TRINITY_DN3664_c0_g1~~TRINITY_DN3664_c0_g1_i1.p1  ORF type:complete len:1070 (+),score=353.54 TRINITY_DN3664_c0_g1_i1:92-3211(+)
MPEPVDMASPGTLAGLAEVVDRARRAATHGHSGAFILRSFIRRAGEGQREAAERCCWPEAEGEGPPHAELLSGLLRALGAPGGMVEGTADGLRAAARRCEPAARESALSVVEAADLLRQLRASVRGSRPVGDLGTQVRRVCSVADLELLLPLAVLPGRAVHGVRPGDTAAMPTFSAAAAALARLEKRVAAEPPPKRARLDDAGAAATRPAAAAAPPQPAAPPPRPAAAPASPPRTAPAPRAVPQLPPRAVPPPPRAVPPLRPVAAASPPRVPPARASPSPRPASPLSPPRGSPLPPPRPKFGSPPKAVGSPRTASPPAAPGLPGTTPMTTISSYRPAAAGGPGVPPPGEAVWRAGGAERGKRLLAAVMPAGTGCSDTRCPQPDAFGTALDPEHPQRPTSWASVTRRCSGSSVYGDVKYDGERLLVHWDRSKGSARYFSRNRLPVPDRKTGGLNATLDWALPGITSCVLDCEMLTGSTAGTMNAIPRAELVKQSRLFPFDILLLEGKTVGHLPLRTRRLLLQSVVRPGSPPGVASAWGVSVASYYLADTTKPGWETWLGKALGGVLARGLEGLVLKGCDGQYLTKGRSWAKLKRDGLHTLTTAGDADTGAGHAAKLADALQEEAKRLFGAMAGNPPPPAPTAAFDGSPAAVKAAASPPVVRAVVVGPGDRRGFDPTTVVGGVAPADDDDDGPPADAASSLPLLDSVDLVVVGSRRAAGTGSEVLLATSCCDGVPAPQRTVCWCPVPPGAEWWAVARKVLVPATSVPGIYDIPGGVFPCDSLVAPGKEGDSPVVEVTAAGIVQSWAHRAAYMTLVSPSVVRARPDRDTFSATTASDAAQLFVDATEAADGGAADDSGASDGEDPGDMDVIEGFPPATAALAKLLEPSEAAVSIVAHCVAAEGRWLSKGAMGRLTEAFGPAAKERYEKDSGKASLGSLQRSRVRVSGGMERWVCSMLVQRFVSYSAIPATDSKALRTCVSRLGRLLRSRLRHASAAGCAGGVDLHVLMPPVECPGATAADIKEELRRHVASRGFKVYVYPTR